MFKRRLKLLGKILLALVVLIVVFLCFERFRGQIALVSFMKELRAKGEKLSPQDFDVSFSQEDNGAPAAVAAIQRLQAGKVLPNNLPPAMKVLGSGRAIVGFREDEWVDSVTFRNGEWIEERTTNHWDQVRADLQTNKTVLTEIRDALDKPVLNNNLDYAQGPKLRIPHLAKAKSLSAWLGADIQLTLREGRSNDAITNLRCQILLPRLMAEDEVLISELVRVAIGAIARTDTWEALQFNDWNDAELATIQDAWQAQRFANAMSRSLELELMSLKLTHEQLRASNEETYKLFELMNQFAPLFRSMFSDDGAGAVENAGLWEMVPFHTELAEFYRREIYSRIWRFAWSYQAELRDLQTVHEALTLMREGAAAENYDSIKEKLRTFEEAAEDYDFYDRIRFSSFQVTGAYTKAIAKAMRAETDRSLCIGAIALKRHFVRHGRYPVTLDAVVPEFLSAVPVDYMDGKAIKYHLHVDGSFVLYSAGEDGKDDGGDLTPPAGSRSKDLWRRRDYVWPSPALPEEVEAYRKESAVQ